MTYIRPRVGLSPLANHVENLKDITPDRDEPVWGIVVHTTGSTIVSKALKLGVPPLDYAVAYYTEPDSYSAHYVIGYTGEIIQISDENERCFHTGLDAEWRANYLDGSWRSELPRRVVDLWYGQWGKAFKSPSHLYPGKSPNNVYVGIELIPVVMGCGFSALGSTTFTLRQHEAVAALAQDIFTRWKIQLPPLSARLAGRLVGHEDLTPHSRSDANGGWDPGALRAHPRFNWDYVVSFQPSAGPGTAEG